LELVEVLEHHQDPKELMEQIQFLIQVVQKEQQQLQAQEEVVVEHQITQLTVLDNLGVQVEEQLLQMLIQQDLETHHQQVLLKEEMEEQQRLLRQLEEHLVAVVVLLVLVVMDLFQDQVEMEEQVLQIQF
tara:strand:- start:279 stop:668 length:390 start_codon:yes stop_codon:yes gene_type:complete